MEAILVHPIVDRSLGDFVPFVGLCHGVCEHQGFDSSLVSVCKLFIHKELILFVSVFFRKFPVLRLFAVVETLDIGFSFLPYCRATGYRSRGG